MRLFFHARPPRVPLEQLAVFCGSLATCQKAGLRMPQSLRASGRAAAGPPLREIAAAAAERTKAGQELSAALLPEAERLPSFFLPVLRCGEQSGRLDETLFYLERHCRLLAGPARLARDTCRVALAILVAGSVVSGLLYLFLASRLVAVHYVLQSALFYAAIFAALWATDRVPALGAAADRARLFLPVLGAAERELATHRFFHALSLLYATGGRRVERMLRLAADAAGNAALRGQFLRAAEGLEAEGGAMADALARVPLLAPDHHAAILAGEEAGKLEAAFDTLARGAGEAAQFRLAAFQGVFFRVVAAAALASVSLAAYTVAMTG